MIPIYKITDYTENRYILSKAVMKRARQINFVGDEELEDYSGKIVSLSLKQVLQGDIKYDLSQEGMSKE